MRWFEGTYIKTERLLASRALFLRIARIRRAPGYFFRTLLAAFRGTRYTPQPGLFCQERAAIVRTSHG